MLSRSIRRTTLLLGALALAACRDSPVSPTATTSEPAVAHLTTRNHNPVVPYTTWFFTAEVYASNGAPVQIGDIVSGKMTFLIMSWDENPYDVCTAYRWGLATAVFKVHGQEYTVGGWTDGRFITRTSCFGSDVPRILLSVGYSLVAQIEIANPADGEDFPLTPPPIGGSPRVFTYWNTATGQKYFEATLTSLTSDPQTKDDCRDTGWVQFGFANQGLCIQYIETGKDSR